MPKDFTDFTDDIESLDLQAINKGQEAFEKAIQTGDFDLMHRVHAQRDAHIQDFVSNYGRLPEQDRTSRRWR